MLSGLRERIALGLNQRIFYGWAMVAVGAAGYFASGPGQSHMFSVFITPLAEDLGLTRTSIASAYAMATLAAAFGLPFIGRLIDRIGVRLVAFFVATSLGIAAMAFGMVQDLVTLSLAFGALRFLGQGSMMLSSSVLVAQWFEAKRGYALSLMALGFSASIALHPPLAQGLIDHVGWREAWFWLGVLTWTFYLPLVFFLVQNKPEDLGLRPDGIDQPNEIDQLEGIDQKDETSADRPNAVSGLTSKEAIRTSAFWIVALSLATFSMMATALFFYQVSILQAKGIDAQTAARIFPVSALAMVIAMPLFGRLLDRLPTQPLFAGAMVLMSLTMAVLAFTEEVPIAIGYAVLFGINNATIHALIGYVWPAFFGRRHLGSIQGTATTIMVIGASIGPLPFGIAFDALGSYRTVLLALSLQPLLCAAAILLMRTPTLPRDKIP